MEGMYGRDAGQLEEIPRSARERWRADHGELSAHPMNPSSTAFGVGGSRAPSSGDDLLAGARPSERPQPTSSRRDSSSLSNAQSEFESGSFAHSFDARGSAARRSLLFGAALGAGLLGWQTMTAARNVARALRPHVSPVLVTRETSQSARDAQEAQEAEDLRLASRLQAEENAAAARDTSAAFVRTLLGARAHAPQSAFSPDAFFDAFRREFRPREDGASNSPASTAIEFLWSPDRNFTEQPLTYEDMLDLIERLVVGGDPGVRPEQMARMPTRIYRRTPGGDPPCCSVCLCDAEDGDEIRTLPCAHEFHARCVDRWLSEHRTCPMCKMDVTEAGGAR